MRLIEQLDAEIDARERELRALGVAHPYIPNLMTSKLQWSVKWYGAPSTHTSSIDGFHVIYHGTETNSDEVAFQTTDGLLVIMSTGVAAQSGPTPPAYAHAFTLSDWGSLIGQLAAT